MDENNNIKHLTDVFTDLAKNHVCAVAVIANGNNNLECIESCADRLHVINMLATAIIDLTDLISIESTQLDSLCQNKAERGN